jgi:hypothetical protein
MIRAAPPSHGAKGSPTVLVVHLRLKRSERRVRKWHEADVSTYSCMSASREPRCTPLASREVVSLSLAMTFLLTYAGRPIRRLRHGGQRRSEYSPPGNWA